MGLIGLNALEGRKPNSLWDSSDKESAVGALQAFAEKDCQEDESFEDQDGRVWELVVSLQHAAALDQSSEQQ